MSTKRRKVWVSSKFGGGVKLFTKRKEAEQHNPAFEPVPFVERLPGDVVLSRDDRDRLCHWLERVGQSIPRGTDDATRLSLALHLLGGLR